MGRSPQTYLYLQICDCLVMPSPAFLFGQLSSEAKESFILGSENGEESAPALAHALFLAVGGDAS